MPRDRDSEELVIDDLDIPKLREQLIEHEGIRLRPYICPAGKLTLGVGRNIQEVGISHDEAMTMLDNDIERTIKELNAVLPWWKKMNEPRRRVLVNMCFNMGMPKLLGFKEALAAMEMCDYARAAAEMKDSLWYRQVGNRGATLVSIMQVGA